MLEMFIVQGILCAFGLTFLLQIFFAVGVFVAARRLRAQGRRVMFAPPIIWALHTVIWGMFVLLPFWLIHYSSLHSDG